MMLDRRKLLAAFVLGASYAPWPLATAQGHGTAPQRVLAELARIAANLRTTSYNHATRIDERAGRYDFDCSAMAAYVLRRTAPEAAAAVGRGRPVAVDFYRAIVRAPTTGYARGWMRVPRAADARPGDVLAWQRPRWFPSRNTGHVAFVMAAPTATSEGVLVRITDATRLAHQDDTRDTDAGASGFGQGTLLVATNPLTGEGVGYGWFGALTHRDWVIPTPVVIGRVLR